MKSILSSILFMSTLIPCIATASEFQAAEMVVFDNDKAPTESMKLLVAPELIYRLGQNDKKFDVYLTPATEAVDDEINHLQPGKTYICQIKYSKFPATYEMGINLMLYAIKDCQVTGPAPLKYRAK